MRAILMILGLAALVLLAGLSLGFIRLDQTQSAQLPRLEGGQAPKFEADVGKIDLGTENRTVEVPRVSIQKPGEAEKR